MPGKSLLEVQFPIAQLSLESYLERSVSHGKLLNSLGKWWGAKPLGPHTRHHPRFSV